MSPAPGTGDAVELSAPSAPPGGSINIRAGGFAPGSEVTIVINSDPVELGAVLASATGTIDAAVTIPSDLAPGEHTLVVSGTGVDGDPRALSTPFTVTAPDVVVTTTVVAIASGAGTTGGSSLPMTGWGPLGLLFWGALLVGSGRVAVLLSRPIEIITGPVG